MLKQRLAMRLESPLFALLIVVLTPVPALAQPLFETEHDWRITIGEHSYGLWQVVQQPGEFRQTMIWCGPWVFHTRLRAAEVAAIAIGPLVLGFAVAMSRWRRRGRASDAA